MDLRVLNSDNPRICHGLIEFIAKRCPFFYVKETRLESIGRGWESGNALNLALNNFLNSMSQSFHTNRESYLEKMSRSKTLQKCIKTQNRKSDLDMSEYHVYKLQIDICLIPK